MAHPEVDHSADGTDEGENFLDLLNQVPDEGDDEQESLRTIVDDFLEHASSSATMIMKRASTEFRRRMHIVPNVAGDFPTTESQISEIEKVEPIPFAHVPVENFGLNHVFRCSFLDEDVPPQDFWVMGVDDIGVHIVPFPLVLQQAVYKPVEERTGYIVNPFALREGDPLMYGFGYNPEKVGNKPPEFSRTPLLKDITFLGEAKQFEIDMNYTRGLLLDREHGLSRDPKSDASPNTVIIENNHAFKRLIQFHNPRPGDSFRILEKGGAAEKWKFVEARYPEHIDDTRQTEVLTYVFEVPVDDPRDPFQEKLLQMTPQKHEAFFPKILDITRHD